MRLLTTVSAAALLAALGAGAAQAQEKCFDKGTLSYVDCPTYEAAPAPAPAPLPPAAPTERSGLYIGVKGGVMVAEDTEFNDAALGVIENEYDLGYVVGGVIGYEFVEAANGLDIRSELEIGYQAADIDEHSINGVGQGSASRGDASVFYGFLNLYGDVALFGDLDLILGGGGGYGLVEFDNYGVGAVNALDGDDGAFGFHLDAGLGYDVTDFWTLEATYRYSSFIDAEVASANGTSNEIDVNSHQGLVGVRYKF